MTGNEGEVVAAVCCALSRLWPGGQTKGPIQMWQGCFKVQQRIAAAPQPELALGCANLTQLNYHPRDYRLIVELGNLVR